MSVVKNVKNSIALDKAGMGWVGWEWGYPDKYFSCISLTIYAGTHWNHLTETLPVSTHNVHFGREIIKV